jgi:hypothetical protein
LTLETVTVGWLAAIIASTIQTLIWDSEARLQGALVDEFTWSPMDDLPSILLLMPFGFVLYTLVHPAGWLFWIGFGSTLWNRSRVFIVVAAAGAVWFGMNWPRHFVAIMGI